MSSDVGLTELLATDTRNNNSRQEINIKNTLLKS